MSDAKSEQGETLIPNLVYADADAAIAAWAWSTTLFRRPAHRSCAVGGGGREGTGAGGGSARSATRRATGDGGGAAEPLRELGASAAAAVAVAVLAAVSAAFLVGARVGARAQR